jgi:hypothetical protein
MLTFPLVVTVGLGITETFTGTETAEVQPAAIVLTLKLPELETVMLCVVSPELQRLPEAELEVSVTDPPAQKVVEPPAETVGVVGVGLTVTATAFETAEVQPAAIVRTVKFPVLETVMLWVV